MSRRTSSPHLAFATDFVAPPRRREPLFFVAITLTSGAETFCTGPSESIALKRWRRHHRGLAESFGSHRVVTPQPQAPRDFEVNRSKFA